jgi:[FeFe] hydrogenase H-cluster maturation GTPase HydF
MQQTPKGLRLHIGIFGRRNVGKSSVFNNLLHQSVAIVSDVAGTTTDPVEKAMELQPIGPVLFVDTAGIDDVGALGQLRVEKTMHVVERVDLAILVTDGWERYETELLHVFTERKTPVILVANQCDRRADRSLEAAARELGMQTVVTTSATTGEGMDALRQAVIQAAPDEFLQQAALVGDLFQPGDTVVLVVPIDMEAPKGRLIMPQVQTIRDILDHDACALMVKERELAPALARLKEPPALVVTDSQEFMKVVADTPPGVPVTSFSILFARFKGDLAAMAEGVTRIGTLKPGDKVLISEACTHHPMGDDIGRVKIPRWMEQYVGGPLDFTVHAGEDLPADLSDFRLIVHCGACMWNRRRMLSRIEHARRAGVPITNYGLSIAFTLGILERALEPFPYARDRYREALKKSGS